MDEEPMQEVADADVDAAAAATASLSLSDSLDDSSQDIGIPYIDRLVSTIVGDLDDEDDTDDEFVVPEEDGEFSEWDDDDEMSYDSDESSVHMAAFELLCGRLESLSEERKEMLNWRLDKDASFSDWTIEVSTEGEMDRGSVKAYHVHRVTLALGPRRSEYFGALFTSGEFSESTENTSRIELPSCSVGCFPDFLDYLYAPVSECDSIITRENLRGLRYLSNYFLVPTLLRASTSFIKRDMRNMEVLAEYLRMFVGSDDDDAREIVAHAAKVCVERVKHIHVEDSSCSPLYVMPPALFLHILTTLRHDKNLRSAHAHEQNHICQLALTYVRYHKESLDENYFSAVASSLYFPDDKNLAGLIAIELLEIIKNTKWKNEGQIWTMSLTALAKYLADGLNGGRPLTLQHLLDIAERIPSIAVAELLRYAINVGKGQRDESKPVTVSCRILSKCMTQSTIQLRLLSSDTIAYVKYQLSRHLNWQPTFVKVYFEEEELFDCTCISGQYSIGESGLLICHHDEKIRDGEVIANSHN